MKDPIVQEVRKHRMEHSSRFEGNLDLICDDLRKAEEKYADRLVKPNPKPIETPANPVER